MKKLSTCLGIAGLFLVGFEGCGGSDEPCAPAGTWNVTASALPGDDCEVGVGTNTRVVTVMNGTATITDPSDGTSNEAPLDSSCHMAYVVAISSPDFAGVGRADWTFNGASLSATIDAHFTATEDGSMCTMKLKLVGVRQ